MTVTLNGTNKNRKTTGDVTVLEVKNLRVHYATPSGDVIAVNGVDLKVFEGETIGLVGESGCGKSTLAMSILRLVQPPGRIVSGQVQIHGIDLIALSERELRQVRWNQIALIPQGAMNSLNPSAMRRAWSSAFCCRFLMEAVVSVLRIRLKSGLPPGRAITPSYLPNVRLANR